MNTYSHSNNSVREKNSCSDRKIIYIAELDEDIDDTVAAEFLQRRNVLKGVVPDPVPSDEIGLKRLEELKKAGIRIYDEIPPHTRYVFVGGGLKKVSRYLKNSYLETLVMNGGFAGDNIEKQFTLPKFKGKKQVRTFNFNMNVNTTHKVLRSKNIRNIILVGKNVCHSQKNTLKGIWGQDRYARSIMNKYHVSPAKLQHDLLMCHEGLALLGISGDRSYLKYETLHPYNSGLYDTYTKWGSLYPEEIEHIRKHSPVCNIYRPCQVAVDWNI